MPRQKRLKGWLGYLACISGAKRGELTHQVLCCGFSLAADLHVQLGSASLEMDAHMQVAAPAMSSTAIISTDASAKASVKRPRSSSMSAHPPERCCRRREPIDGSGCIRVRGGLSESYIAIREEHPADGRWRSLTASFNQVEPCQASVCFL